MTASISPTAGSSIQAQPSTGGGDIKPADDFGKVDNQAREAAEEANRAQQEGIRKADLGPGAGRKIDITI
jgi:hypothetical protein